MRMSSRGTDSGQLPVRGVRRGAEYSIAFGCRGSYVIAFE
jgi:hypothetical protein